MTTTATTPAYRKDGSSLFKWSPAANGYVHVFRKANCRTLAALLAAYERSLTAN